MRKILGLLTHILSPAKDSGVVYLTRQQIAARMEAISRELGMSPGEAMRRLERGELEGTTAEARLRSLIFLIRPQDQDVSPRTAA